MKVIITTSAKIKKTPATRIFSKRLSNLICMNHMMTEAALMQAIISASAAVAAPRCHPVASTEIIVSTSKAVNTNANEE